MRFNPSLVFKSSGEVNICHSRLLYCIPFSFLLSLYVCSWCLLRDRFWFAGIVCVVHELSLLLLVYLYSRFHGFWYSLVLNIGWLFFSNCLLYFLDHWVIWVKFLYYFYCALKDCSYEDEFFGYVYAVNDGFETSIELCSEYWWYSLWCTEIFALSTESCPLLCIKAVGIYSL